MRCMTLAAVLPLPEPNVKRCEETQGRGGQGCFPCFGLCTCQLEACCRPPNQQQVKRAVISRGLSVGDLQGRNDFTSPASASKRPTGCLGVLGVEWEYQHPLFVLSRSELLRIASYTRKALKASHSGFATQISLGIFIS